MLTNFGKIWILTFVMLMPAVWAKASAITTTTTPLTSTTTNDLHGSHAPTAHSVVSITEGGELKGNETREAAVKRILEEDSSSSSSTSTTTTTTSTATPTTTATTSTTTTAATTTTATTARTTAGRTAAVAAGNEVSGKIITTTTEATAAVEKEEDVEANDDDVATTTTRGEDSEGNGEVAATTTTMDKLMTTTNLPPLASLGSVFERLYRIKLSDGSNQDSFEDVTVSTTASPNPTSTSPPPHIQMQAAASYQVAETLADLNEEERKRYGALLFQQSSASKLNIVDLYPMKIEDFQPRIEEVEEQEEPTAVFKQLDNAEEYRQNLMPNEVEMLLVEPTVNQATTATTGTTTATTPSASTSSDFTHKLLAEQDDLITEIERKFQLQETTTTATSTSAATTATAATATPATTTTTATTTNTKSPRTMKLPQLAPGDSYIDRRVKKSFEFPMQQQQPHQHRASDVMALPNIDFANTKFAASSSAANSDGLESAAVASVVAPSHPEFSTTKFYNSKELYNEMLHNKRKLMKEIGTTTAGGITKSSEMPQSSEQQQQPPRQIIGASETTKLELGDASPKRVTLTPSRQTFDATTDATWTTPTTTTTTATATSTTTTVKPIKYEKQLKRAKLLLKALTPPVASEKLKVVAAKVKVATTAPTGNTTASPTLNSPSTTPISPSANLAKSSSKPIARPRILSRLQEKINSLECEIQNVPQDSHLWRGNETHELLLPIVTTEHCKPGEQCTPNVLTWQGEAEIQSGDILIVEINDAMLTTPHQENITNSQSAAHAAQVYQVTRSGHEHCDVTEGVLLDITPLVVDGRKLVTLYDKDLTEGVNLLIVVSELWDTQCVRLKVTTKTDNCGENAECSGKGVCYSNPSMEEYECQCCSGFAGPHCEEIDACNPSPCTNNGICVDLSQGHDGNSYQCLCPYGYAGKNCQYESEPCNPAECMNGGSCVGNSTHFHCDCTAGFTGPLCQHSLNECESSPCLHGICVDQEDGFRCFCQPGFAGELCNFEYNECESNPCQNAGECIDHIGSYECRCTKGYVGNRCQIKVDFCANKPCPEGHRCIDHGNDFSCECPGGRNGPDCNQMPRTCNENPCTHGGTCWSSGESFYCACRPGYTGTMCEDEFVVETVVSSSEFIVDDVNARNFNDKTFGSSVVLKSPIELHNAYFAAGVLAAAIFIVAVVVTICHCKVNQTYRKFSTRPTSFIPILGFSRRPKLQGKLNKHWLSGKGLSAASPAGANAAAAAAAGGSNAAQSTRHLPGQASGSSQQNQNQNQRQTQTQTQSTLGGQLHERPFQRHLAMNLENDMYYTVDFSENSQHSPLIQ